MENNFFIPKDVLKKKNKNKRQELPKNIFAGSNNSVPDKIIIYYSDNIDLSIIDKAIKYKFNKLREGIGDMKEEIKMLQYDKRNKNSVSEKNHIIKNIQDKLKFIDSVENNIFLKKYIEETEKILDKYTENKDLAIAELFLIKANNYINIEKIKKVDNNFSCKACSYDLSKISEDKDGFYICPECNSINSSLKPNKYIKDVDNYNSNYEEDINNFIKIIDKFEGKNTISIHEELYQELDSYFLEKNMEEGNYYINLPLMENGKKEGTSRKKLWNALEKLGYNQYYDETSYIAHIYWGWKIPDLTLYRDQIIKDYQNTQLVWNLIKQDYKRSASLGTQYRLYVHLLAVDYPFCERDDFKIQDMVESLRLHNHAWQRMCQEANIKYFEVSS